MTALKSVPVRRLLPAVAFLCVIMSDQIVVCQPQSVYTAGESIVREAETIDAQVIGIKYSKVR